MNLWSSIDYPVRRSLVEDGVHYPLHRRPDGELKFEETTVHIAFLYMDKDSTA